MDQAHVIIIVLLLVIITLLYQRSEYMDDIPITSMTDADFNNLIPAIKKAIVQHQMYGSFRRQYPWEITTWQYNQLARANNLGLLNLSNAKLIVLQNQIPNPPSTATAVGNAGETGQYV